MRVLIQRVLEASVRVDGEVVGSIGPGLLALVCAMDDEQPKAGEWARRLAGLRVFEDESGRMNRSLEDTGGDLLLVPQFTLSADMKKGLRPSFGRASSPTLAAQQIDELAAACADRGLTVATGRFGADMKVSLINDGPVTIWIDKP